MIRHALLLTLSLLGFTLAVSACGHDPSSQEPIVDVRFLPRGVNNVVIFGAASHPDERALAVAQIDSELAGRLNGIRFYVFHNFIPFHGAQVTGLRIPNDRRSCVVLAWMDQGDGWPAFTLPGLAFEISHLVSGTSIPGELSGK